MICTMVPCIPPRRNESTSMDSSGEGKWHPLQRKLHDLSSRMWWVFPGSGEQAIKSLKVRGNCLQLSQADRT